MFGINPHRLFTEKRLAFPRFRPGPSALPDTHCRNYRVFRTFWTSDASLRGTNPDVALSKKRSVSATRQIDCIPFVPRRRYSRESPLLRDVCSQVRYRLFYPAARSIFVETAGPIPTPLPVFANPRHLSNLIAISPPQPTIVAEGRVWGGARGLRAEISPREFSARAQRTHEAIISAIRTALMIRPPFYHLFIDYVIQASPPIS